MTDPCRAALAEILDIGQQLANVAFNWSQNEGRVLTAKDCTMLKDTQRKFDAAARAARQALSQEAVPPDESRIRADERERCAKLVLDYELLAIVPHDAKDDEVAQAAGEVLRWQLLSPIASAIRNSSSGAAPTA